MHFTEKAFPSGVGGEVLPPRLHNSSQVPAGVEPRVNLTQKSLLRHLAHRHYIGFIPKGQVLARGFFAEQQLLLPRFQGLPRFGLQVSQLTQSSWFHAVVKSLMTTMTWPQVALGFLNPCHLLHTYQCAMPCAMPCETLQTVFESLRKLEYC